MNAFSPARCTWRIDRSTLRRDAPRTDRRTGCTGTACTPTPPPAPPPPGTRSTAAASVTPGRRSSMCTQLKSIGARADGSFRPTCRNSRPSTSASLELLGVRPRQPRRSARAMYSPTVLCAIPTAAAICRSLSPSSCFNRRTSRTFRIEWCSDMRPLAPQGASRGSVSSRPSVRPRSDRRAAGPARDASTLVARPSAATLGATSTPARLLRPPPDGWPGTGTGGRVPPERVAGCTGTGGRVPSERRPGHVGTGARVTPEYAQEPRAGAEASCRRRLAAARARCARRHGPCLLQVARRGARSIPPRDRAAHPPRRAVRRPPHRERRRRGHADRPRRRRVRRVRAPATSARSRSCSRLPCVSVTTSRSDFAARARPVPSRPAPPRGDDRATGLATAG